MASGIASRRTVALAVEVAAVAACGAHAGSPRPPLAVAGPAPPCVLQQPASNAVPLSTAVPGEIGLPESSDATVLPRWPDSLLTVWFVAKRPGVAGSETLCVGADLDRDYHGASTYLRFGANPLNTIEPAETIELAESSRETSAFGRQYGRRWSFRLGGWHRSGPLGATIRSIDDESRDLTAAGSALCAREFVLSGRSAGAFLFEPAVRLVGRGWSIRLDAWFVSRAACSARRDALP